MRSGRGLEWSDVVGGGWCVVLKQRAGLIS